MNVDDRIQESDGTTRGVAILNLPAQSCLRLDGQTIVLQRDDFVGLAGIPSDNGIHFLAIRPNVNKQQSKEPVFSSIATGFVLPAPTNDNMLVRQYEPQIEEVSANPPDDATCANLRHQIQNQAIDPQRLIPYANVMRSEAAAGAWRQATSLITMGLLAKRGIRPGTKIVPGSYSPDDDEQMSDFCNATLQDGSSPRYPAIPVLWDGRANHRRTTHRGTKQFLQTLSPTQRTTLLTDANPSHAVFDMVLRTVYHGNWRDLLGDVQLSYMLFLHLQCHSSLEHWRDTVALSCQVTTTAARSSTSGTASDNDPPFPPVSFLTHLVQVLVVQIQTMERDFWQDVEMSQDNFLVPSLHKLLQTLQDHPDLQPLAHEFRRRLQDRLPHHFGNSDVTTTTAKVVVGQDENDHGMVMDQDTDDDDDDDNDDDDDPVVVSEEEVQAAWQRQKREATTTQRIPAVAYPTALRHRFPILFAAQQPHEDIVMTCARALEAATDVSLVREAADYLEQVEAQRGKTGLA